MNPLIASLSELVTKKSINSKRKQNPGRWINLMNGEYGLVCGEKNFLGLEMIFRRRSGASMHQQMEVFILKLKYWPLEFL